MAIQNFRQNDPRWGSKIIGHGSETMAKAGCGVCALADLLDVRPDILADYMDSQNFITPSSGTLHSAIVPTLQHYSADGSMLTPGYVNGVMDSKYFKLAYAHIAAGYGAVFLMGGLETNAGGPCRNSYWSKAGHYICICGAEDEKLYVHDPIHPGRDGWHSIRDTKGKQEDSFNGNVKKIWLTNIPWGDKKGGSSAMFEFKQIQQGDTGVDVLAIQEILRARGYKFEGQEVALDRSFGRITEACVRRFQSDNKLTVDGVVGPKTWSCAFGKNPV